jgi:hypothetical protein
VVERQAVANQQLQDGDNLVAFATGTYAIMEDPQHS